MSITAFALLLGYGIIGREVDVTVSQDLAFDSALISEMSEGVLGLHVQGVGQLRCAIPLLRTMHPGNRCLQQVTETREPNRAQTPQPFARELCNGSERIELASVAVTADVVKLTQLPEYGPLGSFAHDLTDFIERGDFVMLQERNNRLFLKLGSIHIDNIIPMPVSRQGQCCHNSYD